ncbi:MAG: PspC domain-containing protein [Clostridia bacterium]|jgi:phage shock protein PspC (stress-responsive transcriptional regulator)|nr:PspC domain-containing protein [Clostridia bacterium]
MTNKRLYKSSTDKKLCGVCAGIANFFNIDPTIIRVVFAIAAIFTTGFPFTLLYIVLAFILPEDNGEIDTDVSKKD